MTDPRLRIKKNELAGGVGLAVVLVPTAVLSAVLALAGVRVELLVGIVGGLLAVGAFSVAQYQHRRPPSRYVIFLAKSRSSFARNILRGLTDGLEQYGDIHVRSRFPGNDEDGATFQIESLNSLEVARAHAIIVIPAFESHEVWQSLARASSRGTLVICVDTKPPKDAFHAQNVPSPAFVGSDFTLGGEMIGHYLVTCLNSYPNSGVVVALGPRSSWPARERASRILYQLGCAKLLHRCDTIELDGWTLSSAEEKLRHAIKEQLVKGHNEIFLFVGNDKLAFEFDLQLARHRDLVGDVAIWLIGYDGTTTDDGSLLLEGIERALATVDAVPLDQGLAAADFVIAAYEGHSHYIRKRIVRPTLTELGVVTALDTAS